MGITQAEIAETRGMVFEQHLDIRTITMGISLMGCADENLERIRGLNEIAQQRGQTLAQMAIAWTLRPQDGGQVTSALVGASSAQQIADSAKAVENLEFSQDELSRIDELAQDAGVNIWAKATESTKE